MKIIAVVLLVLLMLAVVRWSFAHWRRQVLPAYPFPADENIEKCAQGLPRHALQHFGDPMVAIVGWTHDHDGTLCYGSQCGQPNDQAAGLRAAMADLEAQKRAVVYYDRLCPYCNRKLAEGERIHSGCRQVEQEEALARRNT